MKNEDVSICGWFRDNNPSTDDILFSWKEYRYLVTYLGGSLEGTLFLEMFKRAATSQLVQLEHGIVGYVNMIALKESVWLHWELLARASATSKRNMTAVMRFCPIALHLSRRMDIIKDCGEKEILMMTLKSREINPATHFLMTVSGIFTA